mmetsp:Transcript_31935/g.46423  ORF Transcript_31935/g.46423 Transcript_31935/m.46423 type:complete len:317 (-) Transcript_31935:519-1469(-)
MDHFSQKIIRNLRKMLEDLKGSINKVGLVILNTILLAETLYQLVSLSKVVSWHHREQVVIHLVLKSTTKPVNEELRESVASSNVSCGSHLELPEIRSRISVVSGHTVVPKTEHQGEEKTTRTCGEQEVSNTVHQTETSETRRQGEDPDVVKGDSGALKDWVLKSSSLHLKLCVLTRCSESVGSLETLVQPTQTRKKKNREVEECLPLNHKFGKCSIFSVTTQLPETLCLFQRPGQKRHGIDIWVSILSQSRRVVQVRHGMVTIVLILPPLHRVSLHQISPKDTSNISVGSAFEHLMMEEIVSQPTALLPEQTKKKS